MYWLEELVYLSTKAKVLRQFRINLLFFYYFIFLAFEKQTFFLSQGQTFTYLIYFLALENRVFSATETNFVESSFNFFSGIYPGLYEIICKVNNKHYIGEAVNILERLGKHSRSLYSGCSECTALQKDWNYLSPKKHIDK